MQTVLIVGGTSGLGLGVAKLFAQTGVEVHITGRSDFARKKREFPGLVRHDLAIEDVSGTCRQVHDLVRALPPVDVLVYAAGYWDGNGLVNSGSYGIVKMYNTKLIAPGIILQGLLHKHAELTGFIAITSTSQWRADGPSSHYCAANAGLGHLAKSASLETYERVVKDKEGSRTVLVPRIKRTLVVAPGGMVTPFWDQQKGKDLSSFLDPARVAAQTLEEWGRGDRYRCVTIPRDTKEVQLVESVR